MSLWWIPLIIWVVMGLTFLHYLAIMNAMRVKKDIPWAAWIFIAPIAIVGVLLDVFLNVVVGSIMFLDVPKEFMFTKRLQRYQVNKSSRRGKAACWICENLLNVFDPDRKHC